MRILSLFVAGFLFSGAAHAESVRFQPEVVDARVEGDTIIVEVKHGGGCGEHHYELVVGPACRETFPVQCDAAVYDTTADFCEALLFREAKFSIKALGLNDPYFTQAFLTITGAEESRATIQLPK